MSGCVHSYRPKSHICNHCHCFEVIVELPYGLYLGYHVTIVLGEIFHICEVSTRSYELLKPVPSTTIIREGTYFVASLMSIYTRYNMCI